MKPWAAVWIGVLVTTAWAVSGCVAARRDAGPTDVVCAVQRVGAETPGLPERIRVTIRSTSDEPVRLTLPRPLVMRESECIPFPMLALFLRDAEGNEEAAVYVDIEARRLAKPETVVLAPGKAWSRDYALRNFYFWGPCGPDTGGDFTRYFKPGETELRLTAAVIFRFHEDARAEQAVVESEPIAVRCAFEDWLFPKRPSP